MRDLHKIILSPVDGGAHTDDAEQIAADCGHLAWIAASSLAVVRNPFVRTETLCARCIDPAEIRAVLEAQGGAMAMPGTREELNRHLGVAETDQLWTQYGVQEITPEEERP